MSKPYTAIADIGPNWEATPLVTVVCSVCTDLFRPYIHSGNAHDILGEVLVGDSTGSIVLRVGQNFEHILAQTGPIIVRNAIITIVHGRVMLETCACTSVDCIDNQWGISISPNATNNVSVIEYTLVSHCDGLA